MSSKRALRDHAILERKRLARKNFRRLILKVRLNRLAFVDEDDQKISLNAKKNIAMMVRQQTKSGTLTSAEKTMFNTNPLWRTVSERKKLVSLVMGLPCFSRLSPKVRARLATVVKLLYLGPKRAIMREGGEAFSVYFIITGEVEVTKIVYDPVKRVRLKETVCLHGPGDCIGEIELIERIRRLHTYVTTNNVELLYIGDEDFDKILRPEMETQWMNKKKVLLSLGYFNHLNEHQIIETCRLSVLKEFNPLETIYHEDNGLMSDVHFVISGECMILQCLKMKVQYKNGNKMFELSEPLSHKLVSHFDRRSTVAKLIADEKEKDRLRQLKSTENVHNVEVLCGLRDAESDSIHTSDLDIDDEIKLEKEQMEGMFFDYNDELYKTDSDYRSKRSQRSDGILSIINAIRQSRLERMSLNRSIVSNEQQSEASSSDEGLVNIFNTFTQEEDVPQMFAFNLGAGNIENHFIDVGSLSFGGIFGIGEELEQRVIMARTTVQCLLIPRYWLLEKDQNPGNLWQRKKFYLNSTIPSRLKLYQNFLTTQKWQKFKDNTVQSELGLYIDKSPTKPQEIPIILKILEEDQ